MAYDVFISYSHHDKATADAICAGLEQDGIRCWYAPRDISPGADWAESIVKAIESVRVMVLIYTEQSNMSRQVLNELSNAVSTGTVVIPFRLTDSPPSKGLQYYFASVHWLDATNVPMKDSIDQLKILIHGILTDKPAEKRTAETKQPAPETVAPTGRGQWYRWMAFIDPFLLYLKRTLSGLHSLFLRFRKFRNPKITRFDSLASSGRSVV